MFISHYFFSSSKKNKSTTFKQLTFLTFLHKVFVQGKSKSSLRSITNQNKFAFVKLKEAIMMAMHSPKLFSALSLIQSNMYCQKKKCTPEILLDIIMYSSYISL